MCVIFFITAISTYELQRKININNHKIPAHSHSLRDRERGRGKTTKKAKWELETRKAREEISSTINEKKLVVL